MAIPVIKMRCSRTSQYDSNTGNVGEVLLSTSGRDGAPLNDPAHVQSGNMTVTFIRPDGDEIEHDSVVDVTIAISAPAAASVEEE